ncbi:MAG: pimeloyl-[acyl-carrier protein] methyl ester esterase [Xanthomonadales bacterium PRO7]|jgi:pimeloyl-[acyl-carrier protein] methyl ester esterase|nr:pimeloyl-[acyl-carrier protein] methyl ester esterase [Xanthomonadales bacterium PRO7]HMM58050.1 pimeloyl-ACP methyl ester esterase BioH [Rudaea sp.]
MHIETLGDGPDIVLLHGWAMHGGIFEPLTRRLRERFHLHVVDLPGHGYSRDDDTHLDPASCAKALLATLPRAIWVGWSFGGLIAMQAALANAAAVRGLVTIAASPRFVSARDWPHGVAPDVFTQFESGLRRDYRATIERFLALEAIGSDDAQAELRELKTHVFERGEPAVTALECGMQVLETADVRARIGELNVSNLWIAGRRDRLVPAAAMRWASRQSPQSHFVEISSGHAPFISHAAQVADAITVFAENLPA